jgi:hypothetical protein
MEREMYSKHQAAEMQIDPIKAAIPLGAGKAAPGAE